MVRQYVLFRVSSWWTRRTKRGIWMGHSTVQRSSSTRKDYSSNVQGQGVVSISTNILWTFASTIFDRQTIRFLEWSRDWDCFVKIPRDFSGFWKIFSLRCLHTALSNIRRTSPSINCVTCLIIPWICRCTCKTLRKTLLLNVDVIHERFLTTQMSFCRGIFGFFLFNLLLQQLTRLFASVNRNIKHDIISKLCCRTGRATWA